jgi:protein-S-isoprenylcysteine O-methyltransferase Ste14
MSAVEATPIRVWSRAAGIAFGVGTHVLFFYMAWRVFWFLRDGAAPIENGSLLVDFLLSLQFGVIHSLLLLPRTRSLVTRYLPGQFYGLLFCVVTSVCLLGLMEFWQGSTVVLWQAEGWAAQIIHLGYYASWLLLFYALSLVGIGFQTGFTPWWHWLRGTTPPRRGFVTHGIYRWLRHPVYLGFLGLIWFTPRMSLDHAVLTGVWTLYVFVGSWLKDERLAFYLGDTYRAYWSRVPGYPLMPFGPLAKRPGPESPATESPATNATQAAS